MKRENQGCQVFILCQSGNPLKLLDKSKKHTNTWHSHLHTPAFTPAFTFVHTPVFTPVFIFVHTPVFTTVHTWMDLYLYLYTPVFTSAHLFSHLLTTVSASVHTSIHTCTHTACTPFSMPLFTHTCIQTGVHIYKPVHLFTICTQAHPHLHTYIHTCTPLYIRFHICIQTCTPVFTHVKHCLCHWGICELSFWVFRVILRHNKHKHEYRGGGQNVWIELVRIQVFPITCSPAAEWILHEQQLICFNEGWIRSDSEWDGKC